MLNVRKKFLSGIIIIMLLLSITACTTSNSKVGNSKKQDSSIKSEEPSKQEEKAVEKPTLRALFPYSAIDYNTYPVAADLEEATGYKVTYEMLPKENPFDKLNIIMASGEPYDVVAFAGNVPVYFDYASKGALTDLTTLIHEYGSNIKKAISDQTFDIVKVDKKIYAIPQKINSEAGGNLMIRVDWLKKLGLPKPETLEQFVEILKEFKEKDPGKIGKDNVIPLTFASSGIVGNINGAFDIKYMWNERNGELVPLPLDLSFKEYLVFMRDLYEQGLLDREFPVNQGGTTIEKFTSGKAGMVPASWYSIDIADALLKNIPEAEVDMLPALKGEDGKTGFSVTAGISRITVIPKSSKNAEHAIKWLNLKLEEDIFKLNVMGEEGIHYEVKDGEYYPINPKFMDERNGGGGYFTGVDENKYPIYWQQCRLRKDPRVTNWYMYMHKELPSETRVESPLSYAPYLAEYSKDNQKLSKMVVDYSIKVIVGEEPISEFEQFAKKYMAEGGEASYKNVNEWYKNVWLKN